MSDEQDKRCVLRLVPSDNEPAIHFHFPKEWLTFLADRDLVEEIDARISTKAPGRTLVLWDLQPDPEHAVLLPSPDAVYQTLKWIEQTFG